MLNTTSYNEHRLEAIGNCSDRSYNYLYKSSTIAVSTLILGVEAYLLIVLIIHGITTGGLFCDEILRKVKGHSNGGGKKRNIWKAKFLYRILLVSILIALSKTSITLYSTLKIGTVHDKCQRESKTTKIMQVLSLLPIYVFLWVRQFMFYHNPHLRQLFSNLLKRFSWSVLAVVVLSSCIFVTVYASNMVHEEYDICNGYCFIASSNVSLWFIVGVLLLVYFQVSLLCLFVYPVRTKMALQSKMSEESRAVNKSSASSSQQSHSRVVSFVRKCFILTVICMISDVLMLIGIMCVKNYLPLLLQHALADIDIIINNICVILCFQEWTTMMCPWRKLYLSVCSERALSRMNSAKTTTTEIHPDPK